MSDDKTIIADPGQMTILEKPSQRRNACLVQYSGSQLGKRFPLDGENMSIGRSPQTDICLDEPSVSRRHAALTISHDTLTVEDLGSSNGTFVNDKKIESPTTVQDQDMIRLGTIVFKYFAHENIDSIIHDKIYRMATIDGGTEIFNKKYLMDELKSEFRHSKLGNITLSVIYYDLDHFKRVNDTYGHACGDHILKEGAAVVKSLIRKNDVLCRFGGEEFIIILPETELKKAAELAERIRAGMENHVFNLTYEDGGSKKQVGHKQTISIGVAEIDYEMVSESELLELADRRLYASKQNGRNRVTIS